MRKMLTVPYVKSVRPDPDKRIEIYDEGAAGLILIVFPSGKKSWIMRFQRSDKRMGKLTLGPIDLGPGNPDAKIGAPLTLYAARRVAAEVRQMKASGLDPFEAKKLEGERQWNAFLSETLYPQINDTLIKDMALAKGSFAVLAREFARLHLKPHVRRWIEMAKLLGLDEKLEFVAGGLAERWEMKLARDVTKKDIVALLDECRADTLPGGRRRRAADVESEGCSGSMYSVLSKFYNWLISRDLAEKSPLTGLEKPGRNPPRDRVLNDAEIRAFWSASLKLSYPYGDLYRFLLLTGVRRDEAAKMTRAEIVDGVWTIPGSRSKNHKAHFVPLAPMAAQLIEATKAESPASDHFVFSTFGKVPVSGFGLAKANFNKLITLDNFVIHDLRRTFTTRLASLNIATPVIEAMIAHSPPKLIRTYHHYDYADERRDAYAKWETKLQEILKGSQRKQFR